MGLDYLALSEMYRPAVIKTLLVGEAPPHNRTTYFYQPTVLRRIPNIRNNSSLPATIFYHYFQELPNNVEEYVALLLRLKELGVFLVDLYDLPIRVRGDAAGVQQIREAVPLFREKLKRRNIDVADENIVFLLARRNYRAILQDEFPESRLVQWIDFRMSNHNA